MIRKLFFALLVAGLSACTTKVKPWERDVLSKSEMQFGVHRLEDSFDDHTYFSKEGSSGGRSFSAGGCGCN